MVLASVLAALDTIIVILAYYIFGSWSVWLKIESPSPIELLIKLLPPTIPTGLGGPFNRIAKCLSKTIKKSMVGYYY